MKKLLPLILLVAAALVRPMAAQEAADPFAGVDLLYPEFAHPEQDARAAIARHDYRFIATDRYQQNVPGVERYPRLRAHYGTKLIRQRFRLFATNSQNFSFNLRARTYATSYNQVLVRFLLKSATHRSKSR